MPAFFRKLNLINQLPFIMRGALWEPIDSRENIQLGLGSVLQILIQVLSNLQKVILHVRALMDPLPD